MLIAALGLVTLAAVAQAGTTPPELAVLDARIGPCTADFVVKSADGAPVYNAIIHVRIRYGALNVKRMDLEVGTNSEGKARLKGLPDKAKPLTYEVQKDDRKGTVDQDVSKTCQAMLEVTLK